MLPIWAWLWGRVFNGLAWQWGQVIGWVVLCVIPGWGIGVGIGTVVVLSHDLSHTTGKSSVLYIVTQ